MCLLQYLFKQQNSTYLSRKNPILPFEDFQKVEWLSKKHDASLFAVTTNSKKRPDNVILGKVNYLLLSTTSGLQRRSELIKYC